VWAAYFGSTFASGGSSVSQTLATTANQLYFLTFDLANDNGGLPPSNSFVASIGGSPIFSFANLPDQGFVHEQFSFIATGPVTTLEFSAFNDQSYAELDNVVVGAAPEPSSIALLITGALAFVARRRSRLHIS
jgi:PEP-CTERM motif